MKQLLICIILGCSGCTRFSATGSGASTNAATSTPVINANQWSASSLSSTSCSGTYQITANSTMMVMTIFADNSGSFSGVAAIAGQGNQSVSGTCANGTMSFTLAGQQYSGAMSN